MKQKLLIIFFILINTFFVFIQNSRVTVLGDLTYIIDHAYRISIGQVLYKDFGVLVVPGTFLIQALIIHICGLTFLPQIAYCCLISAATVFLTYKILFFLNPGDNLNFIYLLPAVIAGGYVIYPHPFYDIDCTFFILLSMYFLLFGFYNKFKFSNLFFNGILCVIPFFFKQNLGIFYLFSIHLIILVSVFFKQNYLNFRKYLIFITGTIFVIAAALIIISFTCGIENYYYWTFTLAQSGKGLGSGGFIQILISLVKTYYLKIFTLAYIASFLSIYICRSSGKNKRLIGFFFILTFALFFLILPLISIVMDRNFFETFSNIWIYMIVINIIYSGILLMRKSYENIFLELFILSPVFIINGGLLGGDLLYTTYSFWPFFSIIICFTVITVIKLKIAEPGFIKIVFSGLSLYTIIVLFFYINNNYRLRYIHLDGEITSSSYPTLRGLSTPGNYLTELQKLLEFTDKEIPRADGILVIPAEDPFYFASDRRPEFPINYFHRLNIPESDDNLIDMINNSQIKWIIVKTKPQYDMDFVDKNILNFDYLLNKLNSNFKLYHTLNSYQIFKKNS